VGNAAVQLSGPALQSCIWFIPWLNCTAVAV
jgi:hypothetical protein